MDKLPISVCMIAGAEAGRISRALKSVAGCTSEIIVVLNDDVSNGTDRIAEAHCAKVFRELWKGFACATRHTDLNGPLYVNNFQFRPRSA